MRQDGMHAKELLLHSKYAEVYNGGIPVQGQMAGSMAENWFEVKVLHAQSSRLQLMRRLLSA